MLKVQAVLNEIDGLDSTGTKAADVPTIFGMNFQAFSVGQKLAHANAKDDFVNTSPPLPPLWAKAASLLVLKPGTPPGTLQCNDTVNLVGGYADSGSPPNTGLQYGLDFVDTELGFMITALQKAGLDKDTLVIIEAKHGQSPINVQLRQTAKDSPYDATPGFGSNGSKTTDDVGLVWLSPQLEQSSHKAAEAYLLSQVTPLGIVALLD